MTEPITTARLILRQWKDEDLAPFAALNGDPEVMEFFPRVLSVEQSEDMVRILQKRIEERGWGLWAVEEITSGEFIGFVGLSVPRFEAAFTPCVEVGWRLGKRFWGKGYASEAARAALAYGFDRAGLEEIVSFTTEGNVRSQRVMERIGMSRDCGGDFDHPELAAGHPLRRHVLYRLKREEWRKALQQASAQNGSATGGAA